MVSIWILLLVHFEGFCHHARQVLLLFWVFWFACFLRKKKMFPITRLFPLTVKLEKSKVTKNIKCNNIFRDIWIKLSWEGKMSPPKCHAVSLWPVAAAVSKLLLMSIDSVVSLLSDDYNATVLCFWPHDKELPSQNPISGPSATTLIQAPWACESSGNCPFIGSRGWGRGQPVGTPAALGWAGCAVPGAIWGHIESVWHWAKESL